MQGGQIVKTASLRVQGVTSVKVASKLNCIPNNWRILYKTTGGFFTSNYTDFHLTFTRINISVTANNIYEASEAYTVMWALFLLFWDFTVFVATASTPNH